MPTTKAQQQAVAKYTRSHYDELKIRVPKGRRAAIEAHVRNSEDQSVNRLVNRLLREELGVSEEEWKNTDQ